MKRLITTTVFSLLGLFQPTFACDCEPLGAFVKVAPQSELVVLIQVKTYLTFKKIYGEQTPMSMEVTIIDVYKGQETGKTIKIWGDDGSLCRPYLSAFEQGKYYVMALSKNSDETTAYTPNAAEKLTNYAISSCGVYSLQVDMDKQMALGTVTDRLHEMSLSELKKA